MVPGAKGSDDSTGSALTWLVKDGQKKNMEHKILTDRMRSFSQANDALPGDNQATLQEWLKEYKEGARDALQKRKIAEKKPPPQPDRKALIDKAAECIEEMAKAFFEDAGVDRNAKLRNPWKARQEQVEARAKSFSRRTKRPRG